MKNLKRRRERMLGRKCPPNKRRRRRQQPQLRFTPTAWAKLRFLRDLGPTEVGGFGISSDPDDLLCIHDIVLIRQECTEVSVAFDDEAVAEFFEQQAEAGLRPEQFARVWIHTHPGNCPLPSGVDEKTFARCFGQCDWAVMFILAENDDTYVRLRWRHPAAAAMEIECAVDFGQPFTGSDQSQWQAEYDARVVDVSWDPLPTPRWDDADLWDAWQLPEEALGLDPLIGKEAL